MNDKAHLTILWTSLFLSLVFSVIVAVCELPMELLGVYLSVGFACIFAFAHGIFRYGVKNLLIYAAIVTIVSFSYENASVITGFPFGHYHYTDLLGPKIWHLPLMVIPAYFSATYIAWVLALILLDKQRDGKLSGSTIFFLPLIATFIMVMWDFVMDPFNSTIRQRWVWEHGGVYLGVPFTNYLGWYLCVYTYNQLFALYLLIKPEENLPEITSHRQFWLTPTLMYIVGTSFVFGKILFAPNHPITTLDGHTWWTNDIYQVCALVDITTAWFVVALILAKFRKNANQFYPGHLDK